MSNIKFKYEVPAENYIALQKLSNHTAEKQLAGAVFKYDEFVTNLFKDMGDDDLNATHAVLGLSGEAGEITDIIKKAWAYEQPTIDHAKLLNELGDLRFYYQVLLNMLGVTDKQIQAVNIAKLSTRFPEGVYTNYDANQRVDTKDDKK